MQMNSWYSTKYEEPTKSHVCSLSVFSSAYLSEAAHEIVANRRSWQVRGAGAPTHVEEIIRAQHGVVLLRVACGGQDAVHRDRHLHNKAQGKDTLYTHTKGSARR